jgi:Glycosyl transferase family 2
MPTPRLDQSTRAAILLSTYNGAHFLPAQLDSLRRQTHENWQLIWRDDGSTDDSAALMRRFAASLGGDRCHETASSGTHLGAGASFLALLAAHGDAAAVAFADQDDLWLPGKLRRGVERIALHADRPALYCSRQILTDNALNRPRLSLLHRQAPGFPASLAQNIATGNTLVMNRSAARLVTAIPAPRATLHDWWSYIVVSACGGVVDYDTEPGLYYRQHAANLIGSPRPRLLRALAALKRGPALYMTMMRRHADHLMDHADLLTAQAHADLLLIRKGLYGGMLERIAALACPRFRRATWLETMLLGVWFLAGGEESASFLEKKKQKTFLPS